MTWVQTPPPPPYGKSQLSNTCPNSLKNYKATKPAFNVGPSSAHQRNAIKMAFRWQADDGPLLVLIGSSLPLSPHRKTPTLSELDPLWQIFLYPRMCSKMHKLLLTYIQYNQNLSLLLHCMFEDLLYAYKISTKILCTCLFFRLLLYVPVNNFSVMLGCFLS